MSVSRCSVLVRLGPGVGLKEFLNRSYRYGDDILTVFLAGEFWYSSRTLHSGTRNTGQLGYQLVTSIFGGGAYGEWEYMNG